MSFRTGAAAAPVPGILRTVTPFTIDEGSTATLSVRLRTQPTGNVNVISGSGDSTALTISPTVRIFTSSNWATPQDYTLTAPTDTDTDDESVLISLLAGSTDTDYNNLNANFTVAVTDAGAPPVMWMTGRAQAFLSEITFSGPRSNRDEDRHRLKLRSSPGGIISERSYL